MKKTVTLTLVLFLLLAVCSYIWERQMLFTVKHQPTYVVRQIATRGKYIALTFDDGPNPTFTPQILRILKKHNAYATFFLLGQRVSRYPSTANMIVNSGHEIGIHSYEHAFLTRIPPSQAQTQVNKTYNAIYRITGQKPSLFRPPYGFYNKDLLTFVERKKLQLILWTPTADPHDYDNPGADVIADRVLANAKPGMIVLLHDNGGNRTQTVLALDKILTALDRKGYKSITVSNLINTR